MIAVVDADILVYRFGFASEGDPAEFALARLSEFLDDLYMNLNVDDVIGYLTGSGNFRNEIAVTAPYKGNRIDNAKPYHFALLREYMEKPCSSIGLLFHGVQDSFSFTEFFCYHSTELFTHINDGPFHGFTAKTFNIFINNFRL